MYDEYYLYIQVYLSVLMNNIIRNIVWMQKPFLDYTSITTADFGQDNVLRKLGGKFVEKSELYKMYVPADASRKKKRLIGAEG